MGGSQDVSCIVLRCLGRMDADHGMWQVALEMTDGTIKPEGIFTDAATARAACADLARAWGCDVEERR